MLFTWGSAFAVAQLAYEVFDGRFLHDDDLRLHDVQRRAVYRITHRHFGNVASAVVDVAVMAAREKQYALSSQLHGGDHALQRAGAGSFHLEVFNHVDRLALRLVGQGAATCHMLRLAVHFDAIVARLGAEDGTTRLANRALGATCTGITCPLLAVQFPRATGYLIALLGFVRTLTPICLDATDIEPDCVIVRLYSEDLFIQRDGLRRSRAVLLVDFDFHCLLRGLLFLFQFNEAILWPGNRTADQDGILLFHDAQNLEVLDRDTIVSGTACHAHALEHARWIRTGTD